MTWPEQWALVSYGLLLLSILSLLVTRRLKIWLGLLTLALAAGFVAGTVQPMAWPAIALLAISALWAFDDHGSRAQRVFGSLGLLCVSAAFMLHLAPGFANHQLLTTARLGDGIPFDLRLNADKPLIGLFVLAFGSPLIARTDWRLVGRWVALLAAAAVPVLLLASLALGYVHFDPKLPALFLVWAPRNLLMTCVAEEAFFRGFLQTTAERWLRRWPGGNWLALLVCAALFGLAHLAGGWPYAILSTVAGLFYGLALLKTGRLEASILLHFLVNATHFLFFTYPAAA